VRRQAGRDVVGAEVSRDRRGRRLPRLSAPRQDEPAPADGAAPDRAFDLSGVALAWASSSLLHEKMLRCGASIFDSRNLCLQAIAKSALIVVSLPKRMGLCPKSIAPEQGIGTPQGSCPCGRS
jgi:hypothetical protein